MINELILQDQQENVSLSRRKYLGRTASIRNTTPISVETIIIMHHKSSKGIPENSTSMPFYLGFILLLLIIIIVIIVIIIIIICQTSFGALLLLRTGSTTATTQLLT